MSKPAVLIVLLLLATILLEIVSARPILADPFKTLDNGREKRGLLDSLLFKAIVKLCFVALTGLFGSMTSHLFGHF